MAPRWQPNLPAVTSEQFDDEIVLVNFDSGKYHSIRGTGVFVWKMIASHATTDGIVEAARQAYTGDGVAIGEAIHAFVAELARESLIVAASGATAAAAPPPSAPDRVPFEPPALATFSDMQELLWLDPIHEVDEAGWPIARADGGR